MKSLMEATITRINCIPPQELSRQHLVGEWKEIHRVFGMVAKAVARGVKPEKMPIPPRYTLGKGHVYFFADKLLYIIGRQRALYAEMRLRGYRPGFKPPTPLEILATVGYIELMNDWVPDDAAMALNRGRIEERTK